MKNERREVRGKQCLVLVLILTLTLALTLTLFFKGDQDVHREG